MKRIILIAALVLPASLQAQGNSADPQAKPAQGQTAKQPEKKKTSTADEEKARLAEEAMMPSLSRSPTGYVEDAAIGTMVRVRFDAGFDMTGPDRAEFFYGKCGCYRDGGTDPSAPGPGTLILTRLRFQEAHINLEYAFGHRFSLFVDGSARSIQPQAGVGGPLFGAQTGPGDLQAGFKFAPLVSPDGYLTFQFRSYMPTGDSQLGLGTNHYSIEPSLLFTRKLTRAIALSGQFTEWHPIGGSDGIGSDNSDQSFAGNVLTYGAGASYRFVLADNLRVAPVLEIVGWDVLSGLVTGTTSPPATSASANIVNAKIGARILEGRHHTIYVGFGRQLTHVGWYRDLFRAEYTHIF